MKKELRKMNLHTVCQEARCPNLGECFKRGTATFLIMGDVCTRNCGFCAVKSGTPQPLDNREPKRVAEEIMKLELNHAVITSPSRDDIPDGGASFFALTVKEIKNANPNTTVEVLIPDFKGNSKAIKKVVDSGVDVLNHNVETVPRLYPSVRPSAFYEQSLEVIRKARKFKSNLLTKSGLMVGLGEKDCEIYSVMEDLRGVDCDILTIGQYLQPDKKHLKVERYVHPQLFKKYRRMGEDIGFKKVFSGPLVRSSYRADEVLKPVFNNI